MVSLFNAVVIPVEMGFGLTIEFYAVRLHVNRLFNFILIVDALHLFLTSYRDNFGDEVFDPYLIYKRQIRSKRFILDVLTILSFLKEQGQIFNFLQIFKAGRVLLINAKVSNSSLPVAYKKYLNVGLIVFNTIFFLHIVACQWYWITVIESRKIYYLQDGYTYVDLDGNVAPNVTFADVNHTIYEQQFLTFGHESWNRLTSEDCLGFASYNSRWDSRSNRWVAPINFVFGTLQDLSKPQGMYDLYPQMMYYALINLGISEFGPKNTYEYLFLSASMICSAYVMNLLHSHILKSFERI